MSDLSLVKDLLATSGAGRTGMKVLAYGESGSGKSPFLASFPRPLVAIDCGEGGIQPYLKSPEIVDGTPSINLDRVKRGEEDVCLVVETPEQLSRAVKWVLENQEWLASCVIDGYNLAWDDHMTYWGEKIGDKEGKIEAGQWRIVKREWKTRQKLLMKSKLHFGMSCWMRDTLYERVENQNPMMKPKLNIRAQEVAAIEKSVPHTTDLILQFSIVRDSKNRPTSAHEIRVVKGRRPRTVPPKELHVGTTFKFRSDKEEDLWAITMAKFEDRWKLANLGDVAEFIGQTEDEALSEEREMIEAWGESEAGGLIKLMLQAEREGEIDTLAKFRNFWQRAIAPTINGIEDTEAVNAVLAVKENIKNRIKGDQK